MKYKTRDFGEVELDSAAIFEFTQPPFGFEAYKKYALLYDESIGNTMAWLQSLEEPSVCFILLDPSFLAPVFSPVLPENMAQLLGEGEYECWVIMNIPGDIQKATVNLKSPVFFNMNSKRGAQIILEQSYSVRHPLMKGAE